MTTKNPKIKINAIVYTTNKQVFYEQLSNINNFALNLRGYSVDNIFLTTHLTNVDDIKNLIEQLNMIIPNFQTPRK